jgi:hypothetical protein
VTPRQTRFLDLLKARMAGAPEGPISEFVFKLDPQELQDCLDAFMTVSARYGIEKKSMAVFWALSSLALAKAPPYFALRFEFLVRPEAKTQWSERYSFLREEQKKEAGGWIARQRKKARPEDFRRLEVLKEAEADIQAASKAAPAPKPGALEQAKAGFLSRFQTFMLASGGQAAKAATTALTEFIFKLEAAPLEECLRAYLEASARYAADNERSLYVFFGMSSRAIHICGGYFALKFERAIHAVPGTVWSQRFAKLDGRQKGILEADLVKVKRRLRVLDELRFAYFVAHGKDPDARALRAFEPVSDVDLSREVTAALSQCDRAAESLRIPDFLKAWDDLAGLYNQKDVLRIVFVLKRAREWLSGGKVMRDELYWYGVGALLDHLLVKRPEAYQRGFNEEERHFFLGADTARHPYYGDFEERFRYLVKLWDFKRFATISRAHAAVLLYSTKRNMTLATMADADRVWRLLESLRKNGPQKGQTLSIPVTQPEGLLKDKNARVSVGDTYGDLTIVWLEGHRAYVECRRLEKVLFIMVESVYSHQLGRLSQERFYDVLHENTKHLLVLIPAFFEILGYIPDLVSGGLGGLARSVAQQYLIGQVAQRAFGDSPEATVFAAAASMATGRFTQPENRATRAINKELRSAQVMDEALVVPKRVQARLNEGHAVDDLPQRTAAHVAAREDALLADRRLQPHAPSQPVMIAGDGTPVRMGSPRRDGTATPEVSQKRVAVAAGTDPDTPPPSKKEAPKRKARAGAKDDASTEPPPRAKEAPPKAAAPRTSPSFFATQTFTRDGIRYRFVGTGEDFDRLGSSIATRFQVYEVRNIHGETIYTGIAGGKTRPRDALDRLREHLYTKAGDFIGDAHTIHIRGVDLDERIARALEHDIIRAKKPHWNRPARDPERYDRKYGMEPSPEEVRRANNANLTFRLEQGLPDPKGG